jgi:hypothetical protein
LYALGLGLRAHKLQKLVITDSSIVIGVCALENMLDDLLVGNSGGFAKNLAKLF